MAVITHIVGGLGNQMFQYAAGRALSLRTRQPLKIDISSMRKYRRRDFSLEEFNIEASVADPSDSPVYRPRGFWARTLQKFRKPSPYRYIRHVEQAFAPEILDLTGLVYLEGYWQSEKYFAGFEDTIRTEFALARPMSNARQATLARIKASNAVSVHVRRGDYVTNASANAVHGTIDPEWYAAAMQRMAEKVQDPTFFVFSDDPAWASANLKSQWPVVFIAPQDDGRDAEDMHLMAACGSHITANSTFSWWGAWLNPNPLKHVIAPLQWFRSTAHDDKDLIPTSWERL
ncbi:alpha-1,2-fucosyltransferase [Rhizobium sp. S152]|uniref:alpha-1,2-fucosyltransferase n=1 Tax=Rhizobium sp. S152 TaxID=3055038 RepID=UPI0025A9F3A5|nr:alpha-1,2-fucosyltransferase [Rhizobium sp. S152]MDM9625973.1 alpha-1,2-fucosyltransferase [Rhizobium sp. S152]